MVSGRHLCKVPTLKSKAITLLCNINALHFFQNFHHQETLVENSEVALDWNTTHIVHPRALAKNTRIERKPVTTAAIVNKELSPSVLPLFYLSVTVN